MVLLLLNIRADLENLAFLQPNDWTEFTYHFQVKCTKCQTVSEKESFITPEVHYPIPKSRGSANLVQKCKTCGSVGHVTYINGHGKPYTAEDSEARKFVPVGCFDCRGVELAKFIFRDGWETKGVTGTGYSNVDLTDGEWSEYDEDAATPVGILNLEHTLNVTK